MARICGTAIASQANELQHTLGELRSTTCPVPTAWQGTVGHATEIFIFMSYLDMCLCETMVVMFAHLTTRVMHVDNMLEVRVLRGHQSILPGGGGAWVVRRGIDCFGTAAVVVRFGNLYIFSTRDYITLVLLLSRSFLPIWPAVALFVQTPMDAVPMRRNREKL